jgi:hypothetical protein
VLHVTLAEPIHQSSESMVGCGRLREMPRTGHQDANRLEFRERCRGARKQPIIALGDKHRDPIDATRNAADGEAGTDTAGVWGQAERPVSRRNRRIDESRKPPSVAGFPSPGFPRFL